MSGIIIYSDKVHLAYELVTAARSIGDEVIGVTTNDEQLAVGLAKRGVKVLAINNTMLSLADTAAIASVL